VIIVHCLRIVFPGDRQDVTTVAGVLLAEGKLDIHELQLIRVSELGRVSDACEGSLARPEQIPIPRRGEVREKPAPSMMPGHLPAFASCTRRSRRPFALARLDDEMCRSPVAIANRMQQIVSWLRNATANTPLLSDAMHAGNRFAKARHEERYFGHQRHVEGTWRLFKEEFDGIFIVEFNVRQPCVCRFGRLAESTAASTRSTDDASAWKGISSEKSEPPWPQPTSRTRGWLSALSRATSG